MDKEYFYNLYGKILQEIKLQFERFSIEVVEYRVDENEEGKLFGDNAGGAIEVVVPEKSISLETFSTVNFEK